MAECSHPNCYREATHILVNFYREIVGNGQLYCQDHAFEDDRGMCSICDTYEYNVELEDDETGETIYLRPAYNKLDIDGYCSEHP